MIYDVLNVIKELMELMVIYLGVNLIRKYVFLEPEMEKLTAEIADYKEQDEDVLTYALFGQTAVDYFKRRSALRNKIDPDAMDMKNKAYPV